jgi:hypothetical protein
MLLLDIGTEWTLNAPLTRLSSYGKCLKRRILGHSAPATFLLRIGGMTKCSRTARGSGCGNILASVADLRLPRSHWATRRTKLPANGHEEWRRRKLLISCPNSPRLNKTYFPTSKADTSLKQIRSAATQFSGGCKIMKKHALCLPIAIPSRRWNSADSSAQAKVATRSLLCGV